MSEYSVNFGNSSPFFEVALSKNEQKEFNEKLPRGYSLETFASPKKGTPHSSKKFLTNEGTSVDRRMSNASSELDILHLDLNSSSNKRTLRDHSKKKALEHLDNKSNDLNALPTTSSKIPKPANETVKKCLSLLQKLRRNASSGPFQDPVDVEGLGLTDYYDIVKEPMDLTTVEEKLRNEEYSSVSQFGADIRKIWNNAVKYNPKGSPVYQMTMEMSTTFEKLYKDVEGLSFNDTVRDLEKKVEKLSKQITELHNKGTKVSHPPNTKNNKALSAADRPMNAQEKKVLCQNIRKLPTECLRGVWEIVIENVPQLAHTSDELSFDIEYLPTKVTRDLDKYVKMKISQLSKSKTKIKGKELTPLRPNAKQNMTVYEQAGRSDMRYNQAQNHNNMHMYQQQQPLDVQYANFQQPTVGTSRENDAESKSSDSSFISDSDSDSDNDVRKRSKV